MADTKKAAPRTSKAEAADAAIADAITAHIRGDKTKRREAVERLVKAL